MADFRLSATAQLDIIDILSRTRDQFGELAQLRYERLLVTAMRDIAAMPQRTGSVDRPEIGEHVLSYHLRHSRERARHESGIVRQPRHFLLYRVLRPDLIGIGRILHDAMEIGLHRPSDYGDD